MIDCEDERDWPSVDECLGFAAALRARGGVCSLVYFPKWYWAHAEIGRPDLNRLTNAGIHLVSSSYITYSDNGPGWQPYAPGQPVPAIWQYTDALPYGGQRVDFNAFKGTVDELRALLHEGAPAPAPAPAPITNTNWTEQLVQNLPTLRIGAEGGAVSIAQGLINGHGYGLVIDGDFGPATERAVLAFQATRNLVRDGVIGPVTYSSLLTA
jgi:hypothetical protein